MTASPADLYGDAIGWVVERKDFNAFWPIGYPAAASAMGTRLIDRLEDALARQPLPAHVANPTAVTVLYLLATFAIRDAGWDRPRRMAFADRLLSVVAASKESDVVNSDGRHVLRAGQDLVDKLRWVTPSQELVHAANGLAGLSWACSEAMYFWNHRIGTERHGPYASTSADRSVVVRTVFDVSATSLWPQLNRWPTLPARIDIGFELGVPATATRFDMFANPLSEYDVAAVTRRVAFRAEVDGEVLDDVDLATIAGWTSALRQRLAALVAENDRMVDADRALKAHRIALYAARTVLALDVDDGIEAAPYPCRAIDGTAAEITALLDLRKEMA